MAFQYQGNGGCVVDAPRCCGIPRHSPALVAVHHQLNGATHVITNGFDDCEVVFKVWATKANLECWVAELASLTSDFDHLGNAAVHS